MSRTQMNVTTMDDIKNTGDKPAQGMNKPKKEAKVKTPLNPVESKSTSADKHKSGWF